MASTDANGFDALPPADMAYKRVDLGLAAPPKPDVQGLGRCGTVVG